MAIQVWKKHFQFAPIAFIYKNRYIILREQDVPIKTTTIDDFFLLTQTRISSGGGGGGGGTGGVQTPHSRSMGGRDITPTNFY